jgi:uncharacterized protein YndB with AHSA1/START domain
MDAELGREGERFVLRFERRLDHPTAKVWRALTERELLRQWFPSDIDGEWRVGAELHFRFAEGEADDADTRGEVLAFEPARLLEFRWGDSVLRCELSEDGDGCRLVFTETFEDGSIAARNTAGWLLCLANLERTVLGERAEPFELSAWRVLFDDYARRFEPEAGPQQGPPETHPAVVAERAAHEGEA